MTVYTIRPGFTVELEGVIYSGGQEVDLSLAQFEAHAHKLEGIASNVLSTNELSWGAIANGTVTTSASDILPADPEREAVILHNSSVNDLLVSFGSTASATSALYKVGGGQTLIEKESFVTERLSAIAVSGTVTYSLKSSPLTTIIENPPVVSDNPISYAIVTDNSANPNSGQLIVEPQFNGIRVYADDIARGSDSFDLFYKINSDPVKTLKIYKHKSDLIFVPANGTVSLGTTGSKTLNAVKVKIPDTFPSSTGGTGIANCDRACPPFWTPTANHVTLPDYYSAFTLNADGTRRQIFVREYDGTKWLPERWYWLEPTGTLTIFCDYPDIAIANQDGGALTVNAPTGTVIGGTSTRMHLPYPARNNTFNVSNITQLKSAIASAVSGDEIVLADGTYVMDLSISQASFTANIGAGKVGSEGIVIRSSSDNPNNCILQSSVASNWQFTHTNATLAAYWRGIGFNLTGLNSGFKAENGIWRIENCKFLNPVSTVEDNINLLQSSGHNFDCILLECEASDSAADCYNGSGTTGQIENSYILMCNCRGARAGTLQSDQVITSHFGLPIYIYGGAFSDANLNVFANDSLSTTPGYAYYSSFSSGARESGVKANAYGNKIQGRTAQDNVGANQFVTNNYIEVTAYAATTTLFRNLSSTVRLEHNYLKGNTGRCFFSSQGNSTIRHNVITGFSEGVRTSNYNSVSNLPIAIVNNTFIGCTTALTLADTNIPITLKNNACKENTTNLAVLTGASLTSNYNTLISSDPDYLPGANDISAIADLDGLLFPIVNGNCYQNGEDGVNRGAKTFAAFV